MKLDTEFIELPWRFDAGRLAAEVAAIPEEAWRPHPQGHPGNSALPLVAAGGDPGNDATKGPMRPTPHLARLPYLRQALAAFGTVLGRTRLMRLDGNAEATPHTDTNYYWFERVRIHLPIVTDPAVRFLCGERELHMAGGEVWIFDTWKTHNVVNPNPTRRIHLVADSVGSGAFWAAVARGRRPFAAGGEAAFDPRFIPFDPAAEPELAFETVNQPVVMSPWELGEALSFVRRELAEGDSPPPLVAELTALLADGERDWRALWAEHGPAPAGWPAFRQRLDRLAAGLARFERQLRLGNGSEAVEIIRQLAIRPALNPDLAPAPAAAAPVTAAPVAAAPVAAPSAATPRPSAIVDRAAFDRPVFLVSSPRSGSSLLFETLAQAPDVVSIGRESHALIEGIEALRPAARGWDSNRLEAEDATPEVVRRLSQSFAAELRDRDGVRPGDGPWRLLEKTPKNALRVPFLARAFPDALFVYLYRDPRETVSSMLDAWRSGRFVTYPDLPGWSGPPWSLLLVPGWRELAGLDLPEIVARQWLAATTCLLDDLEALPPERWVVASYDRLVAEPQAEVERLCGLLGFGWDRALTAPLPLSRHTLTSPEPDKWRHNGPALKPVMPLIAPLAERAREIFARPPASRPAQPVYRRSPAEARPRATVAAPPAAAAAGAPAAPAGNDPNAFRSVFTPGFAGILQELGVSLVVSTYQSGRLIAVRADGSSLNTHFRAFPSPMGMAVTPAGLVLGTERHVWELANQPEVGKKLQPHGKHDACYLPRKAHVTGDIRVHELALGTDGLWIVNTRFSCLAGLDGGNSFVPRWRPPFVSALSADDRCHLNGLAMIDGRPRFVTALGATDTPQGWREGKAHGGVLLDVPSGEILLRGLSMPHSPRWAGGRLWVLESGKGEVGVADLGRGTVECIARLPGFTRGLAFAGRYAFIGLSQIRETNVFGGLPLSERVDEKRCGVWALDLASGQIAAFLRFEGLVQEIFDVQILPARYPEIAEPDSELLAAAFTLPPAALAEVATA